MRNDITVAGPNISDAQLQKSLSEKLSYDRVGYGNVFDAITLQVQNGVVTLGAARTTTRWGLCRWDWFPQHPALRSSTTSALTQSRRWTTEIRVGRAGCLQLPNSRQQIRHRPREADPHRCAKRQCGTLRRGGELSNPTKTRQEYRANTVPGVFAREERSAVASASPRNISNCRLYQYFSPFRQAGFGAATSLVSARHRSGSGYSRPSCARQLLSQREPRKNRYAGWSLFCPGRVFVSVRGMDGARPGAPRESRIPFWVLRYLTGYITGVALPGFS